MLFFFGMYYFVMGCQFGVWILLVFICIGYGEFLFDLEGKDRFFINEVDFIIIVIIKFEVGWFEISMVVDCDEVVWLIVVDSNLNLVYF